MLRTAVEKVFGFITKRKNKEFTKPLPNVKKESFRSFRILMNKFSKNNNNIEESSSTRNFPSKSFDHSNRISPKVRYLENPEIDLQREISPTTRSSRSVSFQVTPILEGKGDYNEHKKRLDTIFSIDKFRKRSETVGTVI